MKKFISLFLTIIFTANLSASAFSFKKKKSDVISVKEKIEYVNINFWSNFNDPYLTYYICEAVKKNHDARKASWQVEEYRQNVKYSFGQELPSLSVGANYAGIKIPKLDDFQIQQNGFILPFIARYEPDFLLKNRDKTKSVKKEYEAVKYEEKAVYISLAGDVATAYLNVLQDDFLIKKQTNIVKVKHEQYSREAKKYGRGVIDNSQFNIVKKEYENVKSDLETLNKNRDISLTQLAVLTGITPLCAKDLKRSTLENFDYRGVIPNQICSDVIFERPDVLASESRLEKAKIDVRVARKEFLPTFNVTAVWIFNTIAPGTFFSWESSLAAIIAGATQDIFKGGMKIANLKMNKARYEQMFEDYKQTDLQALKEISDSLNIIKYDSEVDKNTIAYLNVQRNDFNDMQKKFERGVVSFPELLTEQEKLFNIEQNQAKTKTTRIVNYITLYKAVGGKL